jgi:response regulator RpfG family c-di-GMP phosphodiesterase
MVKAIAGAAGPLHFGHSLRVIKLSRTIAVELGASAADIEQIETAALLHVVGLDSMKSSPLCFENESKLNRRETALMQTHGEQSERLVTDNHESFEVGSSLSRFGQLTMSGGRARAYPSGIGATAIPMGARINHVSDLSIANDKPMSICKRLSVEAVLMELQSTKVTVSDPAMLI